MCMTPTADPTNERTNERMETKRKNRNGRFSRPPWSYKHDAWGGLRSYWLYVSKDGNAGVLYKYPNGAQADRTGGPLGRYRPGIDRFAPIMTRYLSAVAPNVEPLPSAGRADRAKNSHPHRWHRGTTCQVTPAAAAERGKVFVYCFSSMLGKNGHHHPSSHLMLFHSIPRPSSWDVVKLILLVFPLPDSGVHWA